MFLNRPCRHTEWRKLAKKARRKRLRQNAAQIRDEIEEKEQQRKESSPSYQLLLEQQQKVEVFQAEEEARLAVERHDQWLKAEEVAHKQWQELQKKLEAAREERAKQNARIKLEWEREQKRLKEIQDQKEKELVLKREQQEMRLEEIRDFISNGGDTPEHLKDKMETNPNKPPCPFFQKTSACRFFDVCSRNHIRPGVSRTILIPNFYTHYSLEKTENEHGNDSNLEFESDETYAHFHEFFNDVAPEMEKCGYIKQFKVCCNHEAHLRGNVYVEYASTRSALKAYQIFNGRWYGGKQLSAEFCTIDSWKSAVCGLFFINRCPKGNACNFLHVFRNPGNLFTNNENQSNRSVRSKVNPSNSVPSSDRRNWRWSESPERISCGGSSDWEGETRHKKSKNEHSGSNRSKRHRSRSKSRGRSERKHTSSRDSTRKRRKTSRTRSKSPRKNSKRRRSRTKSSPILSHA